MAERSVAKLTSCADGERRIVDAGDIEIGVTRHGETSRGLYFSDKNFHFVRPWHGSDVREGPAGIRRCSGSTVSSC